MANFKIEFSYKGFNETLECNKEELMDAIYRRYAMKIKLDIKKIYFLYNGNLINQEEKLCDITRSEDKINMLVEELEVDEENDINLIQSKDIICPICNEICLINFKDYKITFSDCKNGHRFTKTMLDEFLDFQKIDESKIICNKCEKGNEKKKSEVMNKLFYKCCICNINLCPLCKAKHQKKEDSKNHLIINYDYKNSFCNEHGERYISHCKECFKDLCDNCRYNDRHDSYHKILFLYELNKKKDKKMNELRNKIDILTKKFSEKTKIINKVLENFEVYYNLTENIINSFERKYLNYS